MYSPVRKSISPLVPSARGTSANDIGTRGASAFRRLVDLKADAPEAEVAVVMSAVLQAADLDSRSLNSLLGKLTRSKRPEQAFLIMRWLQRDGYNADQYHYCSAISACGMSSSWQQAMDLLIAMGECAVEMNTVVCSAAISACEKGGQWAQALELLSTMARSHVQKNAITFNAAISACEKSGEWTQALELLSTMARGGIQMNTISCSAAISACEKGGEWTLALDLMSMMAESSIPMDLIVYSSAAGACAKSGEWTQALELLSRMARNHVHVNTIACNAVISACGKGGEWRWALHLLGAMARSSIQMDTVSCSAAISACEKGSAWTQALALLGDMSGGRLELDTTAYGALLSACEKAHLWERALSLFDALCQCFPGPHGISLGSVISACNFASAWSVAASLLDVEMKRWLELERGIARQTPQPPQPPLPLDRGSPLPKLGQAKVEVLMQSRGVVAVAKPPGMASERAFQWIQRFLQESGQDATVTPVSRLDAPTSGVLVVARGAMGSASASYLLAQFAGRLVSKTYTCLCSGKPVGARSTTLLASAPLEVGLQGPPRSYVSPEGQAAVTSIRVVGCYSSTSSESFALLAVKPVTGRTHQIRVHLASLGRPLVADAVYSASAWDADSAWCPRLFLHCSRVVVQDLGGCQLYIHAPFPQDLASAMTSLKQID